MFNKTLVQADTSLLSILANEQLAKFLDGLNWTYDDYYHAESIRLDKVSDSSVIISSVLANINKFKLNDVAYYKNHNILYRKHPRLPIKIKEIKKSFTVTKRAS